MKLRNISALYLPCTRMSQIFATPSLACLGTPIPQVHLPQDLVHMSMNKQNCIIAEGFRFLHIFNFLSERTPHRKILLPYMPPVGLNQGLHGHSRCGTNTVYGIFATLILINLNSPWVMLVSPEQSCGLQYPHEDDILPTSWMLETGICLPLVSVFRSIIQVYASSNLKLEVHTVYRYIQSAGKPV